MVIWDLAQKNNPVSCFWEIRASTYIDLGITLSNFVIALEETFQSE